MDGNFEAKRCSNLAEDKEIGYPRRVFLPPGVVKAADTHISRQRNMRPSQRVTAVPGIKSLKEILQEADRPDVVEANLPLPKSSYDGCEKSYIAANERNIKASKSIFASTGLMAMVCRHDRVISLADIESQGEKQCYPIALLQKLQTGLPSSWTVGILYDVGCQLHRSIKKVGIIIHIECRKNC